MSNADIYVKNIYRGAFLLHEVHYVYKSTIYITTKHITGTFCIK